MHVVRSSQVLFAPSPLFLESVPHYALGALLAKIVFPGLFFHVHEQFLAREADLSKIFAGRILVCK